MDAFGVMAKVESGVRVSSMLLFVLVCCISLSNSADAGDKQSIDVGFQLSVGSLFQNATLTEKQKNAIVTIEFNCSGIDTKKNRTAVDSIYRNVHREILKSLNARKSEMTTAAFSTALVTTTPTSTTLTPVETTTTTTLATTRMQGPGPSKRKKRKKRQQTSDEDPIEAKDLRFIQIDPETDENGILGMVLLLVLKESDHRDCGIILLEAANQTINDGTLASEAGVPVVAIYRGFPVNKGTMSPHSNQNYSLLIWPLVILFVIVLFIVIGVLIYWKKRQDKLEVTPADQSR